MTINRMMFFKSNMVNMVSRIYCSSGSGTASNLFDRKNNTKWTSISENSDTNTATVSYVLPSSTNITAIGLVNHNAKGFNIIYNSGTQFTPGLSLTTITNSNTFYIVGTQAVSSIDINIWSTQIADQEKFIGELFISSDRLTLDTNPGVGGYKPNRYKKGIEQELSDGGVVSIFLSQKFRCGLSLSYINTATYSSLRELYDGHSDFVFLPFPESSFNNYWDGQFYTVNWLGDFSLDNFFNNFLSGYSGDISLAEIPL